MCYKTLHSDSALVAFSGNDFTGRFLGGETKIFLVNVTGNRCGSETPGRCRFNSQVTFHAPTLIPRPERALFKRKAITEIKFSIWVIRRG